MSYAIVFSSKTGNTELLADTLHSCLPQADCCYFGNPNPAAMEADTLYVGFWTDKGKADESSSDFLKQLRGKQVFLFGTAGFGGSEEYFNKILKTVQKDLHSSNTVIGSFMCQGKMPMSVRQRYENMKKQPLHLPNLDAMIENFDKALSHPDADDLERLKQAVKQAKKAYDKLETPIGCVIVHEDKIIARGYNKRNMKKNTLAHAEILAINKASKVLGDWLLEDCAMYVTLEPCPMCAGAIVQARIPRVVIGSMNPKAGCAGSVLNLLQQDGLNHQVEVTKGVLAEECSGLMTSFFRELRKKKKA